MPGLAPDQIPLFHLDSLKEIMVARETLRLEIEAEELLVVEQTRQEDAAFSRVGSDLLRALHESNDFMQFFTPEYLKQLQTSMSLSAAQAQHFSLAEFERTHPEQRASPIVIIEDFTEYVRVNHDVPSRIHDKHGRSIEQRTVILREHTKLPELRGLVSIEGRVRPVLEDGVFCEFRSFIWAGKSVFVLGQTYLLGVACLQMLAVLSEVKQLLKRASRLAGFDPVAFFESEIFRTGVEKSIADTVKQVVLWHQWQLHCEIFRFGSSWSTIGLTECSPIPGHKPINCVFCDTKCSRLDGRRVHYERLGCDEFAHRACLKPGIPLASINSPWMGFPMFRTTTRWLFQ